MTNSIPEAFHPEAAAANPEAVALYIAKRMTAARLQKTWTRDELAQRASVNVHTLKRFERTGQIALHRLIALAATLDLLDDFVQVFKPRQRADEDWQVTTPLRQRGRRRTKTTSKRSTEESA